MPIDLTGINNHNEFFYEHYLTALFEKDLEERKKAWEALGDDNPIKAVRSLVRGWNSDFLRRFDDMDDLEARKFSEKRLMEMGKVLGFDPTTSGEVTLAESDGLQVMAKVDKTDGTPGIWVLNAFQAEKKKNTSSSTEDEEDEISLTHDSPLTWPVSSLSWPKGVPKDWVGKENEVADFLGSEIFARDPAPRWVLLLSPRQIVLCDRGKWAERRFLRFDLETLSARKDDSALFAMTALLHHQSLLPSEGLNLLDSLDEQSHKHAFGVSQDLKYALRECIEDLGNEIVFYIRGQKKKVYDQELAGPLTRECLRTMYKLLFLFYLEARPELGYLPKRQRMRNRDAYWSAYSLEHLRDLELVRLTMDESRNGYYFHESLSKLFLMVYEGFKESGKEVLDLEERGESVAQGFSLGSLNAHLFDPLYDPEMGHEELLGMIRKAKVRNSVWQKIIQRMSLGKSGVGKRTRRGRISYAQLGINQLGAVYEGLLSFRGFFAEEDLYEVQRVVKEKKQPDDENEDDDSEEDSDDSQSEAISSSKSSGPDPLETAYFVTVEQLKECRDEEKVWVGEGANAHVRNYPKGTFIYRMAGRDREKSASYYTPSELTSTLVHYALEELLKDKKADEILDLNICEPAMGSAAFLNEAVDQMAEVYLLRKQAETGQHLPIAKYSQEKQRVKMYLADTHCFGVDLNPVAVELAEVSLWLGTLHPDAIVPWFRLQLNCGNSLVGARRSIVSFKGLDLSEPGVPVRQPWDKTPGREGVWHWLLPDPGMCNYKDRVIKELLPKGIAAIKNWKKEILKPVNKGEEEQLIRLSGAAEQLWQGHAKQLAILRERTTDHYNLWPRLTEEISPLTTRSKDEIVNGEIYSRQLHAASPYRRLKMAMDYWCALWFWPIEKTNLLPDRESWLLEMGLLLGNQVYENEKPQTELFPSTANEDYKDFLKEYGMVDVDELVKRFPRFALVQELADNHRFFHWELEYADIFKGKSGFDLILGNPPWLKVEWNEGGVMGDANPLFILRDEGATDIARRREMSLRVIGRLRETYIEEYEALSGLQNILNAQQNYPELLKSQSNLYKCFLPLAWRLSSPRAVTGLLHPEGIYDDPKGAKIRESAYSRLRGHYQFENQLNLFADVHHNTKFSINIYGPQIKNPRFLHIANLFLPSTINESLNNKNKGPVPGLKDENNRWDIRGHVARSIEIDKDKLALFATLYDEPETPYMQSRLPSIHSRELVEVLRKFSAFSSKLETIKGRYTSSEMWHETNAQKEGLIKRKTQFPSKITSLIFSGPHFFVGNIQYKTPRKNCIKNNDYDILESSKLPEDYLPRTNYVPALPIDEYLRNVPRVNWGEKKPLTEYFRLVFRKMLSQAGERTLISAIMPKQAGHIHGCISFTFEKYSELVLAAGYSFSLISDFFVKTTGKANLGNEIVSLFPLVEPNIDLIARTLILSCSTNYFSELWSELWSNDFRRIQWTKTDPRLDNKYWLDLKSKWDLKIKLGNDYSRRQALIEIDVIISKMLGLDIDELIVLYRVQFPVLRQYELDTWFDAKGRIVFTPSKGLIGVGLPRKAKAMDKNYRVVHGNGAEIKKGPLGWEEVRDLTSGTVIQKTIQDDTQPGGVKERIVEYEAPFDRCDREADYREAWEKLKL